MTINVIGSENAKLYVSDDGATYDEVPGVQSHTRAEGTLTQRQTEAWEGKVSALGAPDVPTIAVAALANPQHPAWAKIIQASRDRSVLNWRVVTAAQVHFSRSSGSDTVSVAAGDPSLVTFAGSAPNFGAGQTRFAPGMSLEIDTVDYAFVFTDVGPAPEVARRPARAAVGGTITAVPGIPAVVAATGNYSIRTPSYEDDYDAIPSFPGDDIPSAGDRQFAVTLYPYVLPPDGEIVKTH